MENNEQQLDLGIISINNEGKVTIQILLDDDLFSPSMKQSLQEVCNQLQIIFCEVAKELENRSNEKNN